ncbi:unnamed protein product [Paramecium primaurelia]|uniref:Uncharacterized protein n=1 Tax=Paramecium primaurelia TaxID=5886 RepID=A0A8S1NYU0_PARPR|nr:unnamed protein product [Paramecium primaurelia]
MIIQKGNKIQIDNPNEELDKEVLQNCKTHEAFFRSYCTFCYPSKDPEEFYCQSDQEKPINYFILDFQENKYLDNQLYNAGISSYDQFLHKDQIANLKNKQGTDPKDIAIQLGLYTQQDVEELIDRAVQENWQDLQEFSVTVDFWEISQTKTFFNRAEQILEYLNLHNSIIIYPSKRAQFIKMLEINQKQASRFLASFQIIDQQASQLKSDTIQIQRKSSLPEYADGQQKRILNSLLKTTQYFPFGGEIVYFTDDYKDLQTIAFKFGKQSTPFNIYCDPKDIDKYYNVAGLSGGKVYSYFSEEKRQITHKLRAIISNNYIFTESQTNKFEKFYTDINFPIDLDYELKDPTNDNPGGCLQVILEDDDGYYVEQKIIQMNSNDDLHEPSVSLSQETLNLTDLPKE